MGAITEAQTQTNIHVGVDIAAAFVVVVDLYKNTGVVVGAAASADSAASSGAADFGFAPPLADANAAEEPGSGAPGCPSLGEAWDLDMSLEMASILGSAMPGAAASPPASTSRKRMPSSSEVALELC